MGDDEAWVDRFQVMDGVDVREHVASGLRFTGQRLAFRGANPPSGSTPTGWASRLSNLAENGPLERIVHHRATYRDVERP